jgi:hypothetical protein
MPDELDRDLRRYFAALDAPLAAEPFTSALLHRLEAAPLHAVSVAALRRLPGTVISALWVGIAAPLRLEYAGTLAATTAAMGLWAAFA